MYLGKISVLLTTLVSNIFFLPFLKYWPFSPCSLPHGKKLAVLLSALYLCLGRKKGSRVRLKKGILIEYLPFTKAFVNPLSCLYFIVQKNVKWLPYLLHRILGRCIFQVQNIGVQYKMRFC